MKRYIYTTTYNGGVHIPTGAGGGTDPGSIFRYSISDNVCEIVYKFNSLNCSNPSGRLLYDNGYLYGTAGCDTESYSAAFKIPLNASGLYSGGPVTINNSLMKYTRGGFIKVGNYLYCTASGDGTFIGGGIYKIDPTDMSHTLVFSFDNPTPLSGYPNPNRPFDDLYFDGTYFYCACSSGGLTGAGGIAKFSSDFNTVSYSVFGINDTPQPIQNVGPNAPIYYNNAFCTLVPYTESTGAKVLYGFCGATDNGPGSIFKYDPNITSGINIFHNRITVPGLYGLRASIVMSRVVIVGSTIYLSSGDNNLIIFDINTSTFTFVNLGNIPNLNDCFYDNGFLYFAADYDYGYGFATVVVKYTVGTGLSLGQSPTIRTTIVSPFGNKGTQGDMLTPRNGFIALEFATICLHAETLIHTPKGFAKIHEIKEGDIVIDYNDVPIKVTKNVKSLDTNKFICIKKNSLECNVPDEDLYITEGHPIFFNGIELQPSDLVDGNKIYFVDLDTSASIYTIITDERTAIKAQNMNVFTWSSGDFELEGSTIYHLYK